MESIELARQFASLFGVRPAIFSAPGRVNLIGEHTDYNEVQRPVARWLNSIRRYSKRQSPQTRIRPRAMKISGRRIVVPVLLLVSRTPGKIRFVLPSKLKLESCLNLDTRA
jgi:hypothetical protein